MKLTSCFGLIVCISKGKVVVEGQEVEEGREEVFASLSGLRRALISARIPDLHFLFLTRLTGVARTKTARQGEEESQLIIINSIEHQEPHRASSSGIRCCVVECNPKNSGLESDTRTFLTIMIYACQKVYSITSVYVQKSM